MNTRLWHYTSIKSCISIIESQCLRMTHATNLNDSKEFFMGLEAIHRAYKTNQSDIATSVEHLRSHGLHVFDCDDGSKGDFWGWCNNSTLCLFIASLSSVKDSLYQWIAYPHDIRQGGGCAICFNTINTYPDISNEVFELKSFKIRGQNTKDSPILTECIYLQNTDVYPFDEAAIERASKQFMIGVLTRGDTHTLDNHHIRCALRVKHHAFHVEREWRLACPLNYNEDPVKIHGGVKPYIEASFDPSIVCEIMVSPRCCDVDSAVRYLEDFVKSKKLAIRVSRSDIPFRPTPSST